MRAPDPAAFDDIRRHRRQRADAWTNSFFRRVAEFCETPDLRAGGEALEDFFGPL